jgi:hypothetical protein
VAAARLVAALGILVVVLAGSEARGSSMTFAPRVHAVDSPNVSTNWSGYAAITPSVDAGAQPVDPLEFTDVTGSWREPKARCVKGRVEAAAFWVGIGGFDQTSSSLQQLGTTAQCNSRGNVTYFAWWEIVPAPAVTLPLKVRPGDRVTAAVIVKDLKVTLSLKNATRHTRFSKTVTLAQLPDVSSAEWIAEAPSACMRSGVCQVVQLANFGRITFGNASATANELSGTINNPTWLATPIQLVPDGRHGNSGAVPGSLSADGRSFQVFWQRVSSGP